jgi:hypothetical protein
MALNFLEEIDVAAQGDTIVSGFTKAKNNFATIDTELHAAREGGVSLDVRLDAIDDDITALQAGTGITDGVLTEAKLDIHNAPTNGYYLSWNTAQGKPQWIVPGSAEDSGGIAMNIGDTIAYVDDKLGDGLENDGSDNIQLALGTGLEFVSGDVAVSETYLKSLFLL